MQSYLHRLGYLPILFEDDGAPRIFLSDAPAYHMLFSCRICFSTAIADGGKAEKAEENAKLQSGNVRFATTKTWVQSFQAPERTNPKSIKSRVEGCLQFGYK